MERLTSILCLVLISTTLSLPAQYLERKGSLGVEIGPVTDSIATIFGLEEAQGAHIKRVLPQSTAENLKLHPNDIILSVLELPIPTPARLIEITSNWRDGDLVEMEVFRKGEMVRLGGSVKGKPVETSPIAEVIYSAVPFEEGFLRSILHIPKEGRTFPTVFYIQGFDCGTIDHYYDPTSPTRQWVEGLVQQGFAVYRVEKPGVGDSEDTPPCADIDYETELAAFQAAYEQLLTEEFVDTSNVFLFGHSLGGITAPIIAQARKPKGIMVYGTVLRSWFEYMVNTRREQPLHLGTPYPAIEFDTREYLPLLYEWLVAQKNLDELKEIPEVKKLLDRGALAFENEHFVGRHYTFWQGIQRQNVTRAWHQLGGVPTLAIYGEYDIHAIDSEDAENIAAIVNANAPGKGTFALLKGTEHGFAKVPSMEAYAEMRQNGTFNGAYRSEHFNPEITKLISQWMRKYMGDVN